MKIVSRMILIMALLFASNVLAMPLADARHLLARTGFDAPPEQVVAFSKLTREQGIHLILEGATAEYEVEVPAWTRREKLVFHPSPSLSKADNRTARRQTTVQHRKWWRELSAWLLEQSVQSKSPLTERMTFFWQNHFVSSWQKVVQAQLLFDQYHLLRSEALGSYAVMLRGIARDPAMLIYLDNRRNKKNRLNENFAREILELFSLGEGNYTEKDVKEAARALSGWTIDKTAAFTINNRRHDAGVKNFLGESGRFDADDIIDIILKQDATAEFLVRKLWREFVSPEPVAAEVSRLAQVFRAANYEIKPLLGALFSSSYFWEEHNRGVLIKSPLQFVVGFVRSFELPVRDYSMLLQATRRMGQHLFNPPNVKGWPGGNDWIDASSLMARRAFLARALRGREMRKQASMMGSPNRRKAMPASLLAAFAVDMPVAELQQILLCCEPASEIPSIGERDGKLRALLFDPVYHLY